MTVVMSSVHHPANPSVLALTANCGLDGISESEFNEIMEKNSSSDIILISAQECHLSKTLKAFNKIDNNQYTLKRSSLMHTFTKPKLGTGMVTIALVKKDSGYKVNFDKNHHVWRNSLSGLNKGGVISEISVTKDKNTKTIHAINFHLDSNNKEARLQDLFNVYWHKFKSFTSFDELAVATPYLAIAAGDTNIRNKYDEKDTSQKVTVWPDSKTTLASCNDLVREILLVEGGIAYSNDETYCKHNGEAITKGARKGHLNKGALDRVTVTNNSASNLNPECTYQAADYSLRIKFDEKSKRDHMILGTSVTLNDVVEFERVRNNLCHRLVRVAPILVKDLKALENNDESKQKLLDVHNYFYDPSSGLIRHLIDPKGVPAPDTKKAIILALRSVTLDNYNQNETIEKYRHNAQVHLVNRKVMILCKTAFILVALIVAAAVLGGFAFSTMGIGGVAFVGLASVMVGSSSYLFNKDVTKEIENISQDKSIKTTSSDDSSRENSLSRVPSLLRSKPDNSTTNRIDAPKPDSVEKKVTDALVEKKANNDVPVRVRSLSF